MSGMHADDVPVAGVCPEGCVTEGFTDFPIPDDIVIDIAETCADFVLDTLPQALVRAVMLLEIV